MTQAQLPVPSTLPVPMQRYVQTGAAPGTWQRDLVTASNQVPRWAYIVLAATSAWYARKSYLAWRKQPA